MMLTRRTLIASGLAAAAGVAVARPALAATYAGYVMGYFTESPSQLGADYGLHLAVSSDGLNWTPLNQNNPVVTPTAGTGGLRDPYLLRKQDGTFVVLATDLTGTDFTQPNQYIHCWDSADLRSFTGYRRLRMHTMNTHTWAPEAFWDATRGQYGIIYSANNGGRDGFWVNYTSDFRTVGPAQLFFDPGFNVLDATTHVHNNVHYLYYKSFVDGRLYGARSSTLNPRSFDNGTYTAGVVNGGIEAPIVVKANDRNEWWLWGDSYSPNNGELYVWRSGNIGLDSWTPLTKAQYTQPLNAKHPTITPITATEQSNLLSRWGSPGLEPDQVLQLPRPPDPARQLRRPHRPLPLRPLPRLPVAPGARPGRLLRGLVPVGQRGQPLPPPLRLHPGPGPQRRHQPFRGRRHVPPNPRPGRQHLDLVPLAQRVHPLHPARRLRAATRPAEQQFGGR